jgi:small subunit ribosomal protein S6
MQSRYEITFLVKVDKTNEDVLSVLAQNNATIDATNDIGERELAYTIAKHNRAHYWSILFTCDPSALVKIEKSLRIKKDVLRFLIISRLREAEKPTIKPKPETTKTTQQKQESNTIAPEDKPIETKSKVKIDKKPTIEAVEKPSKTKKATETPVKQKKSPAKKPTKPKTEKEFSSKELNKKLEELVKED